MALSVLSLLGVLLVIHSDFRTVRLTVLVFMTLPFALIGGVFGAVWAAACCRWARSSGS